MFERNVAEKNGTPILKPEPFSRKSYNFINYKTKACNMPEFLSNAHIS
jgi:hypothetical protein